MSLIFFMAWIIGCLRLHCSNDWFLKRYYAQFWTRSWSILFPLKRGGKNNRKKEAIFRWLTHLEVVITSNILITCMIDWELSFFSLFFLVISPCKLGWKLWNLTTHFSFPYLVGCLEALVLYPGKQFARS